VVGPVLDEVSRRARQRFASSAPGGSFGVEKRTAPGLA
jgi:hypothetical protein